MYPYHSRLRQLLRTENYYVTMETGKWAYRFHFPALGKSYPIKEHRVPEYAEYIKDM